MSRPVVTALVCTLAFVVLAIATHPSSRDPAAGSEAAAIPYPGAGSGVVAPPAPAASLTAPASARLDTLSRTSRALAAAATVSRFCRLLAERSFADAQTLLDDPSVWPRRELRACTGLRFVSARLAPVRPFSAHPVCGPSPDALVLAARLTLVRAAGSPRPPRDVRVRFTMLEDQPGGAWFIAAVAPRPGRRASSRR